MLGLFARWLIIKALIRVFQRVVLLVNYIKMKLTFIFFLCVAGKSLELIPRFAWFPRRGKLSRLVY